MCGIAGFERFADDSSVAASLASSLRRRGPDGSWCISRGAYTVVQTRLAVVDLSNRVSYPMPNESRDLWLLFNGEIYDYPSVRRDLERRGHTFATACDAEVVVHAFEEWDVGAFERLDGMFAIALVDERRSRLVLARDRFGIKPLVRTTSRPFAFSSDAVALVAAGLSGGHPAHDALAEFLAFHYLPPPATGIADIREVEPGTAVVREGDGSTSEVRWSRPVFLDHAPAEAGIDDVDAALLAAVERQLVADVDVGILLSSGLDSALLLCYAVELGATPRTFTLAFPGHGDYDESVAAARLARSFGVPHEATPFQSGFAEAVERVADAFDKPFADSSAIATLQIARLARSSVTVALSGTGGDELFAGYYRLRAHRLRRLLALLPERRRGGEAGPAGGDRRNLLRLSRTYAARLRAADLSDDFSQYLSLVGSATSREAHVWSLRADDLDPEVGRKTVSQRHGLSGGEGTSTLRRLQEFELRTYLPGDVLMKDDRATMDVGLEGRVPFLDEKVVNAARHLPDGARANLFEGKRVLRALAHRKLPRHLSRRKRGFAVPLAALLSTCWSEERTDWISNQDSELVAPSVVVARLRGGGLNSGEIWALSVLMAWESRLKRARVRGRRVVPRGQARRDV
jgi:asparagine synthase (glutamine-hydrolysing)